MIRYSCHSENFGILPPEDTFRLIHQMEFDCIDIAARSLMPQSAIQADPEGCAAELARLSSRYRLPLSELFLSDVESGGRPVSPVWFGSGPEALRRLEESFVPICRFARQAGFRSIMGGAGKEDPQLGFAGSFDQTARALARQTAIAAEFGLAFHVEPSRLSLLHTVKAALDMTQAAPGLRYTLDFLHYHVQGVPLAQSLQLLPFAGHMHARQARAGAGKCDFFQGEIDYPAIAARMKEMEWQGDIAMEFWCSDELRAQGVLASEQNILMRCCLKRLLA